MKAIKPLIAILTCCSIFGCQQPTKQEHTSYTLEVKSAAGESDLRPKEEISFLNRVKAESDYEISSNAVLKDTHIAAFNKYAKDTLKNITGWEMLVTEINDNESDASSFAKTFFNMDSNPVYNLKLVAVITNDRSVDTIAIDNRVDFTYTIPKNPQGDALKKQLAVIQSLTKGDTVTVSGSLTHIDGNSKVNFASFYDDLWPWDVDLLATNIHKKSGK